MISSCKECKTKCCRSGPGPYKSVDMRDWLLHTKRGSGRYNTKCQFFNEETELCNVWEIAPNICKTYVCGVRTYTPKELEDIDKLIPKP